MRSLFHAVAFVLFATVGAVAAEEPIPPAPTHWVTDAAGILSRQTVQSLDARLQAYEASTHHQVLVYVAPTTGQTPLEQWTVRAFAAWKIGRKGLDDGVALFVFSRDRTVRIEVGYGLEEALPDATASRIIRNGIVPWFHAGDFDRGVTEGVALILGRLGGEGAQSLASPSYPDSVSLSLPQKIAAIFFLLVLVLLILRNPWIALYMLMSIMSGGRGGGMSMGGGGFQGGGGRSGGGGASGSW